MGRNQRDTARGKRAQNRAWSRSLRSRRVVGYEDTDDLKKKYKPMRKSRSISKTTGKRPSRAKTPKRKPSMAKKPKVAKDRDFREPVVYRPKKAEPKQRGSKPVHGDTWLEQANIYTNPQLMDQPMFEAKPGQSKSSLARASATRAQELAAGSKTITRYGDKRDKVLDRPGGKEGRTIDAPSTTVEIHPKDMNPTKMKAEIGKINREQGYAIGHVIEDTGSELQTGGDVIVAQGIEEAGEIIEMASNPREWYEKDFKPQAAVVEHHAKEVEDILHYVPDEYEYEGPTGLEGELDDDNL